MLVRFEFICVVNGILVIAWPFLVGWFDINELDVVNRLERRVVPRPVFVALDLIWVKLPVFKILDKLDE